MLEDLELITRLMARFHRLEVLYLPRQANDDDLISKALVAAYAAILEYLADLVHFFDESMAVRVFKAPFRSVDAGRRKRVLEKADEADKLAALIDAERLLDVQTQVTRLSDHTTSTEKVVKAMRYQEVLGWLSPVPYSRDHESQREYRVAGTGRWLF